MGINSYKEVITLKCYKHHDLDAVSTCLSCGKALCPSCSEKFSKPYCDGCILEYTANQKRLLIKNAIIMVILFIFGLSQDGNIVFALGLAGVPWGWSTLNRITPNIFLIMPIIGWVIYFIIKFALSMCIGIFVLPYQVFKIIKGIKDSKNLEDYTLAN
jgi:hypothetical protein